MQATMAKPTCAFLDTTKDDGEITQKACKVVASWMVGVVVIDKHRIDRSTIWFRQLIVCNRHRQQLTLDNVLSDKVWQEVVKSQLASGNRKPKRSLTVLAFRHLRLDV